MMKLFILVAGMGSRLRPLTKNTPKCLIDLGDGTTLLERIITQAVDSRLFNELVMITGYMSDQIDAKLHLYRNEIKISTIFNPFYDTSNAFMSLWAAHFRMNEGDFMITNGDNIYSPSVWEKAQNNRSELIQLLIDLEKPMERDDMKVQLNQDHDLVQVRKDLPYPYASGVSVGLVLVKGVHLRNTFINKIKELVKRKEFQHMPWHEVFNCLVEDGIAIRTTPISQEEWKEADFVQDIVYVRENMMRAAR